MPDRCQAPGCRRTKLSSSVSFFNFPSDQERAKEWCRRCQIDYDSLPKHRYLCEEHFDEDQFTPAKGKRILMSNAAPKPFSIVLNTDICHNSLVQRCPFQDITNRPNQEVTFGGSSITPQNPSIKSSILASTAVEVPTPAVAVSSPSTASHASSSSFQLAFTSIQEGEDELESSKSQGKAGNLQ